MRLSKIKLCGFKSFVDPTVVSFPGQLVGVVGPNGCGKSNIIDAIRWVMGESSAKTLRGESMTDVIFNGSSTRKPLGQASVELFFDNSDGRIGGEYSAFAEIALKRQVNREGQSSYFINNIRCRRRDIVSVFSGTGVKSRSYSIIEQGMVSRFIEAKPDDLRAFLEEAAGISTYKERRRETETRLQQARDNVARVTDLRDELAKQLQHLAKQAQTAERFQVLQVQERLLKGQLLAIKYRDLAAQLTASHAVLNELDTRLLAQQTQLQRVQTETEHHRQWYHDAVDEHRAIQEQYYATGQEISRIEQSIAHEKEKRAALEQEYAQVSHNLKRIEADLAQDLQQIEQFSQQVSMLEPEVAALTQVVTDAQQALAVAETALDDWQQQWDECQHQAHQQTQMAEVAQTKIQHAENQWQNQGQRAERLHQELAQINLEGLAAAVLTVQQQLAAATQVQEQQQRQLADLTQAITHQRAQCQQAADALQSSKQRLQSSIAQRVSVDTLQQAALGKNDQAHRRWLEEQQLSACPRLAQQLEVAAGWEFAVEAVLGSDLQAVCIDNVYDICRGLRDLPQNSIYFMQNNAAALPRADTAVSSARSPLLSKVTSSHAIGELLEGVYCADNLTDALSRYEELATGESLITPDGVWLSREWLRVIRPAGHESGVIARERQLQQLNQLIAAQQQHVDASAQQLADAQHALTQSESERAAQQQRCNDSNHALADVRAALKIKQSQHQQASTRQEQLLREFTELEAQQQRIQTQLQELRQVWSGALATSQTYLQRKTELQAQRDKYQQQVAQARTRARALREELHELTVRLQTAQNHIVAMTSSQTRLIAQRDALHVKQAQLQRSREVDHDPVAALQAQLHVLLEQRLTVEQRLQTARVREQSLQVDIDRLENEREQLGQEMQQTRTALEQQRLAVQGVVVRQETIIEQLTAAHEDSATMIAQLPAQAQAAQWEEEIASVERKIQRLGAINLAAIDEYQEQQVRKEYLDTQLVDLQEALTTLENAIRKIDKETRHRFKETYDSVNTAFQRLFPAIFNGGAAYLALTEEDNLLATGITVMAQPPGKRNSTIHLLSGGEKALTAIALVFAIFELNPSPFCILDEVDAPLDDTNVERYCRLVKDMSHKIQFIFISHNKLAMEMADQLMGVTMNEPGVSRLVAVDIQEAVALAEA